MAMLDQSSISQLLEQVHSLEAELSGLEIELDTGMAPPTEGERLQHRFLATGEEILQTRKRLLTQLIAECYQEQKHLEVMCRALQQRNG
jgi:hypothetical protein